MALIHACNGVMDLEAALDGEGHILGMRVRDVADEGANVLNPHGPLDPEARPT